MERLLSVFEVGEKPAWLKSLVCKFLVAEAPAEQAAGGPSASHAAGPPSKGGEKEGGGSAAAAASPQQRRQQQLMSRRQQPEAAAQLQQAAVPQAAQPQQQQPPPSPPQQRRRQAAMEGSGSRLGTAAEQAEQELARRERGRRLGGEREGEPAADALTEASQSEAPPAAASPQRPKKSKKKKAAKPPLEGGGEQAEAGLPGPGAAALPAEEAVQHDAAAAAAAPQGKPRGQPAAPRQRAPKEPTSPSSPAAPAGAGGKARRAQRMPPPPGLQQRHGEDGPAEPQSQQARARAGQRGRLPAPVPGRADAPGRWRPLPPPAAAGVGGGKGPHRGPLGSGSGSSSDISSEADLASLARPSSVAGLTSRSSSPPAEPDDLPAPTTAVAALAGPMRPRALDTPAAVSALVEELLPHGAPRLESPLGAPSSSSRAAAGGCQQLAQQAEQQEREECEAKGAAALAAPRSPAPPAAAEAPAVAAACCDDVVSGSEDDGASTPRSSAPSTPRGNRGGVPGGEPSSARGSLGHGYPSSGAVSAVSSQAGSEQSSPRQDSSVGQGMAYSSSGGCRLGRVGRPGLAASVGRQGALRCWIAQEQTSSGVYLNPALTWLAPPVPGWSPSPESSASSLQRFYDRHTQPSKVRASFPRLSNLRCWVLVPCFQPAGAASWARAALSQPGN